MRVIDRASRRGRALVELARPGSLRRLGATAVVIERRYVGRTCTTIDNKDIRGLARSWAR